MPSRTLKSDADGVVLAVKLRASQQGSTSQNSLSSVADAYKWKESFSEDTPNTTLMPPKPTMPCQRPTTPLQRPTPLERPTTPLSVRSSSSKTASSAAGMRGSMKSSLHGVRTSAYQMMAPLIEEDKVDTVATIGKKEFSPKCWRVIVQTFFGSCMCTMPFAAFSLTGGLYGRDENMDSAAIGIALALFKLGRLGTLVVLNTLPERHMQCLGPAAESRHATHLMAVVLGAAGALCTSIPQPALLCAGAMLLGFGWTDPILQVHANANSGGCKNVKVQLLDWIWKGRLLGMLLGSFGGGYLYDAAGWPAVIILLAAPHLSYLVFGSLSLKGTKAPHLAAAAGKKGKAAKKSPGGGRSSLETAARLSLDMTTVAQLKGLNTGEEGARLQLPWVLLLLSACCVVEYTLAAMLSTMPLYFTTGLGSTEAIDVMTFGIFDTLRVVLATLAVLTTSFCSRRCRRADGEARPVWIKLCILCPLYSMFVLLPITRDLRLAMMGHMACGVLFNLVGPILAAEYLCSLPEKSVKRWVSIKTVCETLCSSLGSFYGPFALTSGSVVTIFLVPAGLLIAVPVAERVAACLTGGKAQAHVQDAKKQHIEIRMPGGGVIKETVASFSRIFLDTPDEGGHELRGKFGEQRFWANNSQALSCLAASLSALGHPELGVDEMLASSGAAAHHALGRPLTHLAVKTMLQHMFLGHTGLTFAHWSMDSFEDVVEFEEFLKNNMKDSAVLLSFSAGGELEGLFGKGDAKRPAPDEGWAIPVRISDEGLVQLMLFHGEATDFVRVQACPSALLFERCMEPSTASPGLPRGIVVVGHIIRLRPRQCEFPLRAPLEEVASRAPHAGWRRWYQPAAPYSAVAAVASFLEWNCGLADVTVDKVIQISSAKITSALHGGFTLKAAHRALGECAKAKGLNLRLLDPVVARERGDQGSRVEFARMITESILAKSYPLVSFDPSIALGEDADAREGGRPGHHLALAIGCDMELACDDDGSGGLLMMDPDPERYGRYWSCSVETLWRACLDEDAQSDSTSSKGLLAVAVSPQQEDAAGAAPDDATNYAKKGDGTPAGWAAAPAPEEQAPAALPGAAPEEQVVQEEPEVVHQNTLQRNSSRRAQLAAAAAQRAKEQA